MNKSETTILKGVAILMMIFHHLFNRPDNVYLCADTTLWNGQSLLLWLSNACNPVAFFVLLGGFGMYIVNSKGDNHRYSRILKLYTHFWTILTVFLIIGYLMFPDVYPGSIEKLLTNLIGYEVDYNNEYWFLFPYVILMLSSPYLFKITSRYKSVFVILSSAIITLFASFLISRYKDSFLINHTWLLQIVRYFNFFLAFMIGAMAAREQWFEKIRSYLERKKWAIWPLLMIVFIVRCGINTSIVSAPYAFLFILLFLAAPRAGWIDKLLSAFGKVSMDIWFIHTWICYYLFHDWIYSLHHPMWIFLALSTISYVLAYAVNCLLNLRRQ